MPVLVEAVSLILIDGGNLVSAGIGGGASLIFIDGGNLVSVGIGGGGELHFN